MRYRGVMFRLRDDDAFVVGIPVQKSDGTRSMCALHKLNGVEMDATPSEFLLAEFVISDGTVPMTMEDFLLVSGKQEHEFDIYVKSVVVAKQQCKMDVSDMLKEDEQMFASLCIDKIIEANNAHMFDEDRIIPMWEGMGYDRSSLGEAVNVFIESNE